MATSFFHRMGYRKRAHRQVAESIGRATLVDADLSVDFARHTTPGDLVAVIATAPLTRDERWLPIVPNELQIFRGGENLATYSPRRGSP